MITSPTRDLRNLFGEPVATWAVIQAAVVMAVGFGWLGGIGIDGQDSLAVLLVVMNALAAVHIAVATHHTLLGPLVEAVKALVGLSAIYGLHITNEQTAGLITLLTALAAAWHRTQTSPVPAPDVPETTV